FEKLHFPAFHPPEHFTREGYLRHFLVEGLRTRYGIHARAEGQEFVVERVEDARKLPTYREEGARGEGRVANEGDGTPNEEHGIHDLADPAVAAAVKAVIDRLQLELKVIEKTGFLSYVLIVGDFVR